MTKDLLEKSFEELMADLKTTLASLEKGELSLEDSMKCYESGVTLVRMLEDKLKKMEGRMEEILADGTVKDLDPSLGDQNVAT
jgi:exodeoxyribonuclease VII small subunit